MWLYIIIALVGLVVLFFVIALILPKDLVIQTEIEIEKPASEVFDFVIHLKNQKYWSKWVMADPNAHHNYTGTDGTVGFIAAWDSQNKNVGKGAQEITKIIPGKRYDVELRFEKPFKATNNAYTEVIEMGSTKSKVISQFSGTSPVPFNVFSAMMKKMLTRDMNQNLVNLKNVLEKGIQA